MEEEAMVAEVTAEVVMEAVEVVMEAAVVVMGVADTAVEATEEVHIK